MMALVLRKFSAYTMDALLDLPLCHFIKLFEMAELVERVDMYDIFIGANAHDPQTASKLTEVMQSRLSKRKQFESVVTEEAKRRADQQVREFSDA